MDLDELYETAAYKTFQRHFRATTAIIAVFSFFVFVVLLCIFSYFLIDDLYGAYVNSTPFKISDQRLFGYAVLLVKLFIAFLSALISGRYYLKTRKHKDTLDA